MPERSAQHPEERIIRHCLLCYALVKAITQPRKKGSMKPPIFPYAIPRPRKNSVFTFCQYDGTKLV